MNNCYCLKHRKKNCSECSDKIELKCRKKTLNKIEFIQEINQRLKNDFKERRQKSSIEKYLSFARKTIDAMNDSETNKFIKEV